MKDRVEKLRLEMARTSVDCFLVTEPANIFYFSGFTGDDGLLLITEQNKYVITDARFELQLKKQAETWQHVITRNYLQAACELVAKEKLVALGFEAQLPYWQYDYLDENLTSDLVVLPNLLEKIRSVKDRDEIAKIKAACKLAGQGYDYLLTKFQQSTQWTERQLATELDYFMKSNGASDKSFETIVASGLRTAWPHGTASDKLVKKGDLITLDYGYYLNGYTSDVTRTFAYGSQPAEVRTIYQVVDEARALTIQAVKAGVSGKELDRIGRDFISQAGYGEFFNHGMGHGIGLSIHELPNVGARYDDVLQAGQVITIEPGIYLPNIGGVRIEDDILVTEAGYEILTNFGRNYQEL